MTDFTSQVQDVIKTQAQLTSQVARHRHKVLLPVYCFELQSTLDMLS
jgi:hypothetical protein